MLVKTQVYRPIFFNYDDKIHFTSDATQYSCTTDKFYVNHKDETRKLVLDASYNVD